jgi:hypothetical protein
VQLGERVAHGLHGVRGQRGAATKVERHQAEARRVPQVRRIKSHPTLAIVVAAAAATAAAVGEAGAPAGASGVPLAAKLPHARAGARAAAALVTPQRLPPLVAVHERIHRQVGNISATMESQHPQPQAVVSQHNHTLICDLETATEVHKAEVAAAKCQRRHAHVCDLLTPSHVQVLQPTAILGQSLPSITRRVLATEKGAGS